MSRFCTENRFNEKVSTMETIDTLSSTFPSSGGGDRDDASTALTTSGSSKLVPVGSDLICMLRMESFSHSQERRKNISMITIKALIQIIM